MRWISLSQRICWAFSSLFNQKFLFLTKKEVFLSKTLILTVIFTSGKLNWPGGSFIILKVPFNDLTSLRCLLSNFLGIIDQKGMRQAEISIQDQTKKKKEEKEKKNQEEELLWEHSTQTPQMGKLTVFSMNKADNSDQEKVNMTWTIYSQGWMLVSINESSWYINIQKK